ncbi:serine/threonine-protein kinase [Actinomadura rupiterrae]|uniref:serine/threonine-protein kinase n=1 Tax=Actinomadura rupiterrae TaxID=559627 RepID=UPI0020A525A0|nr:protein kinase [Actinomadura rupiterrae]MCP2341875.1 serine/threonine protein kinase [Actinomadura rupiterrae]
MDAQRPDPAPDLPEPPPAPGASPPGAPAAESAAPLGKPPTEPGAPLEFPPAEPGAPVRAKPGGPREVPSAEAGAPRGLPPAEAGAPLGLPPAEVGAPVGLPAGPAAEAAAPLGPSDPRAVGAYPLLGRLGAGGMGTVYLGQDPNTGARVAVKTIHPHLADDPRFLRRFRDEAVVAGRVASFCTARVLAHGEEGGRPYIVSEYVAGISLQQRISSGGPLPAADLHGVAVGVATALAAIHAAGLVHRDLKPANVLLTLSGCRVIDFGIARVQGAPGSAGTAGTVIGTPGWMPPEVIAGDPVSPAADVFSWGCLVAYAGTGRLPFGEGAAPEVALRAANEEPDLAGLPMQLVPAVRSTLAKNPEDRPSASELLMSLVEQTAAAQPPPSLPHAHEDDPDAHTQSFSAIPDNTHTQIFAPAPAKKPSHLRTRVLAGVGAAAATVLVGAVAIGLSDKSDAAPSHKPPSPTATASTPAPTPSTPTAKPKPKPKPRPKHKPKRKRGKHHGH